MSSKYICFSCLLMFLQIKDTVHWVPTKHKSSGQVLKKITNLGFPKGISNTITTIWGKSVAWGRYNLTRILKTKTSATAFWHVVSHHHLWAQRFHLASPVLQNVAWNEWNQEKTQLHPQKKVPSSHWITSWCYFEFFSFQFSSWT